MSDSDAQISSATRCAFCGKPAVGIHIVPSPCSAGPRFESSPGVLYCNEHQAEALDRANRLASEADREP